MQKKKINVVLVRIILNIDFVMTRTKRDPKRILHGLIKCGHSKLNFV